MEPEGELSGGVGLLQELLPGKHGAAVNPAFVGDQHTDNGVSFPCVRAGVRDRARWRHPELDCGLGVLDDILALTLLTAWDRRHREEKFEYAAPRMFRVFGSR